MQLRGICLVCEKRRDDCVLVRFEGDLLVYCRACAHPPHEETWDTVLAPRFAKIIAEEGSE